MREQFWKKHEKKKKWKNKRRKKNEWKMKKKKRMKKKSPQNVISNKACVRVRYQSRRQTEFTTHTNRAEPVCLHVVFILSSCFWFSTYTDILYTITICFCLACIVSRLYFWFVRMLSNVNSWMWKWIDQRKTKKKYRKTIYVVLIKRLYIRELQFNKNLIKIMLILMARK